MFLNTLYYLKNKKKIKVLLYLVHLAITAAADGKEAAFSILKDFGL